MNKNQYLISKFQILSIVCSSCSAFALWKVLRSCIQSAISARLFTKAFKLSAWAQGTIFITGAIILVLALDWWFEIFCEPPIPGLPQIPGWPIVGNLFQQGPSAAMTYWSWRYEVFQLRLGTKRVVVANSFNSIYNLWQVNWKTNISRPTLYTFHQIISKSQGTTIGTTPYSETWRRMKKVVAANLSTSSIQSYAPILNSNSSHCISCLKKVVGKDIDVHPILEIFTLCIVGTSKQSKSILFLSSQYTNNHFNRASSLIMAYLLSLIILSSKRLLQLRKKLTELDHPSTIAKTTFLFLEFGRSEKHKTMAWKNSELVETNT